MCAVPIVDECPRCGQRQFEYAVECAACGVILAKARPAIHLAHGDATQPETEGQSWHRRGVDVLLRDERADRVSLAGRGLLLLMLLRWTWLFATSSIASNAAGQSWLHLVNLPFHEAGHILFLPLGELMTAAGGSLLQVFVPAALMAVFLTRHRDPFGAAVTWWWCGENLVDLAPYIGDARALQLVLLSGRTGAEVEGHDWERILTTLGWLHLDQTLSRLAQAAGVIIMLSALVWGVCLLAGHWRRSRETSSSPD